MQTVKDKELAACNGADTDEVRESCEHMEECRYCGHRVRHDLTNHPFFGFAAGCPMTS
jgi:hypothetical protein